MPYIRTYVGQNFQETFVNFILLENNLLATYVRIWVVKVFILLNKLYLIGESFQTFVLG